MYIGKNGNDWEFVDVNPNDIRYMFLEEKDSSCNYYKQDMFIALNLKPDDVAFLNKEGIKTMDSLLASRSLIGSRGVALNIPPKRPTIFSVSDIFERKEIPFDVFRERCLRLRMYTSDEEKPYTAMNIKAKVLESSLYITQILIIVDHMGLFSFVKED